MTPEQQKILNRCKRMLKLVFPVLDGKLIFHLAPEHRNVKVAYINNDACNDDVEFGDQTESTVDLRDGVTV